MIRIQSDKGVWTDHELGHVVEGTEGVMAIQGEVMSGGEVVWRHCHVPSGALMFPDSGFSDPEEAELAARRFWRQITQHTQETLATSMEGLPCDAPSDVRSAYMTVWTMADVCVERAFGEDSDE